MSNVCFAMVMMMKAIFIYKHLVMNVHFYSFNSIKIKYLIIIVVLKYTIPPGLPTQRWRLEAGRLALWELTDQCSQAVQRKKKYFFKWAQELHSKHPMKQRFENDF